MHYRHVKTVLERLQVPDRTVGHIMADLEDHDMISEISSEDRYKELSDIHQRCRKLVGAGEFETPFGRFVGILRHQLNLWEQAGGGA